MSQRGSHTTARPARAAVRKLVALTVSRMGETFNVWLARLGLRKPNRPGASKLLTEQRQPRPSLEIGGQAAVDLTCGPGHHRVVGDLPCDQAGITTLFNHADRTVAVDQFSSDVRWRCMKLAMSLVKGNCPKSTVANKPRWPRSSV